ncbi:hypothetical protein DV736_g4317, partial [Chaetothyriales sp. CBS 134916]
MTAPVLPTKFPFWCRAVYSWGGESPKDLGFIEGDLIECLNAGDGSWWVGRLRRDPRMIGSFPSNFVKVLDSSFTPVSRSVSPMPEMAKNDSFSKTQADREAKKARAKSRKPFQGYKTALPPKANTTQSAPPSPQKPAMQHHQSFDPSNPPSTVLWQIQPDSRNPSRSPSPAPGNITSSPPPPPPPHRSLRNGGGSFSRRTPSPQPPIHDDYGQYRNAHTPSPGIASMNGHTPPMIRSAMDDVMSSLDDMTVARRNSEPENDGPLNPWSPEAFNNLHAPSHTQARALTSLGLGAGGSNYSEPRLNYSSRHNSPDRFQDGSHQLETYVQRMESRLRQMQEARDGRGVDEFSSPPPEVPPKNSAWAPRPRSALNLEWPVRRNHAMELGHSKLDRTFTTKTSSTNTSSCIQSDGATMSNATSMTAQSVFSGYSAGGFSATSAGSLARKRMGSIREKLSRPMTSSSIRDERQNWNQSTPAIPASVSAYSGSRSRPKSAVGWEDKNRSQTSAGLGGFNSPRPKKQGFLKKLIDTARTGAASARSTISVGDQHAPSSTKMVGIAGGSALNLSPRKNMTMSNLSFGQDAGREMGLASATDHGDIMTRRDVYRSNTPSPSERQERADRCAMLDHPVICSVEELYAEFQGDEDGHGQPVYNPFQLSNPSFSQVDKAARSITGIPTSINAATLATGYLCRPYRTMAQRLRAIFIWCAERISWEDDGYDISPHADTIRVIQTKRGSSREVAALVAEMCRAIDVHAQVVRGHLKTPGDDLDLDAVQKPNHFWNMVLVDNEWRMLDASIASPTNPMRTKLSSVSNTIAEAWYFLTRPSEACWTHVPCDQDHQHMVPPVSPDSLLALPQTCPPFFRLGLSMHAYDTSIIRMEGLEVCTLSVNVPCDVEIVAEVEAKAILQDQDGDRYEDTDNIVRKRALAQPAWYRTIPNTEINQKRYVIKAILPGDEGQGVLKVYAGKKGLMLSARDIVHPLAFALPLYHYGQNPSYEFVKRHPTPHATRHDLYIVQPQTYRLSVGETYVFCVRQHHATATATPTNEQIGFDHRPISPNPLLRPTSAMSMTSSSAAGSNPSQTATDPSILAAPGVKIKDKPAKLAIQSPGGKITRLPRRSELPQNPSLREIDGEVLGSVWENTLKLHERGTWRALVLADRQARWCVWAEWECV